MKIENTTPETRTALRPALLALLAMTALPAAAATLPPVDYSDSGNWVARPPAPAFPADIFYVYPTVVSNPDQPLMEWESLATRAKTLGILKAQTGPFASFATVYAPYCRQIEYSRILDFLKTGNDPEGFAAVADRDVADAFDYYARHLNTNRPFFLLGHSQGANNLLALLRRGFPDDGIRSRFVAAYLIGASVKTNEAAGFPDIRLAQGADDTGVIVSYNTQASADTPSVFTGPGVYGINPLNWRTDATPADKSLNLGAVLYNWSDNTVREVTNFCGAVLDPATGAVIVEPSDGGKYDARRTLGPGVYHMNDIYFFYRNLEENAKRRLAAWETKQGNR